MKCPIDGNDLVITDRQGVEIDYCPQCRGVWLDRGELDKIIERTMGEQSQAGFDNDGYEDEDRRDGRRRRKGGFLSEVFDIFD